jgi:cell wall-associated NlpC family hydrolase
LKIRIALTAVALLSLNVGATHSGVEIAQATPKHKDFNHALYLNHTKHKLQVGVSKAIARANKTRYVFSGEMPSGWDCSGLVRWVYKQSGIVLPHSANAQGHLGVRVSIPKRGDIVVFAYPGRSDFNHAAIYLGQGLILDANRAFGMTVIEPLSNFKGQQIRFVRVL